MTTLKRTAIILLAGLILASVVWPIAQTAWADSFANAVIAETQAAMRVAYDASLTNGTQPNSSGTHIATSGNLVKIGAISAAVWAGSLLLDWRKKSVRP